MSGVATICQDVLNRLPSWVLIRDVLAGSKAVKKKTTAYLPQPNASDISKENLARYEAYVARAVFYNATARTHHSLVGQVFAKPVSYKLPSSIEALTSNIDGAGVSLEQQLKQAVGHALAYGRAGVLADYTSTNGATVVELDKGKARAILRVYQPFDIINHRTNTDGKLILLVLKEQIDKTGKDEFIVEQTTRYRVLRLHDSGATSQFYVMDSSDFIPEGNEVQLLDADGNTFDEIPFSFIGAANNDADTDPPPLYDLAELNLAHYRNSADYEESCYLCGQPTPYVTGLTEQWVDDVLKGELKLGSRAVIPLPAGASAGLLQANPNSMPKEAMEHKEKQMAALGAKLVEKKTVERTATEVNADEAASISVLGSVAKNVESAYRKAITFAAMFMGDEVEQDCLTMSTDFDISRMSAGARQQLLLEWQAGAISWDEYRDALRQSGIATEENDVAKQSIKENPPPALVAATASNNPDSIV